eukprot:350055-Hanusia_phi.AAC.1
MENAAEGGRRDPEHDQSWPWYIQLQLQLLLLHHQLLLLLLLTSLHLVLHVSTAQQISELLVPSSSDRLYPPPERVKSLIATAC